MSDLKNAPLEIIYEIASTLEDRDIMNLPQINKRFVGIRFKLNDYYTMKDYNRLKDRYDIHKIKDFDQSLDTLPQTLTHLTFGHHFNQSVDNLPQSLTHLIFGFNFNQTVDKGPLS